MWVKANPDLTACVYEICTTVCQKPSTGREAAKGDHTGKYPPLPFEEEKFRVKRESIPQRDLKNRKTPTVAFM